MPKTMRRVLRFELCVGMGTTELASDCLESSVPFYQVWAGFFFEGDRIVAG
jgi:hypothetical protein